MFLMESCHFFPEVGAFVVFLRGGKKCGHFLLPIFDGGSTIQKNKYHTGYFIIAI